MSATLPPDLKDLNSLILTNPAIVHLKDSDDRGQLTEYQFPCNGEDKYLLLYVILKLKLIKGRCIIFVNLVDRAYQIKLFLEKFGIKTCILNSELPLNSRYHIIQEFNRGKYDYIIATDEYKPAQVIEVKEEEAETKEEEDENAEASKDDDEIEVKEEDKDDGFPNESDDEEEETKEEEATDETKESKPKKKKQKKQKKKQQYDAVTGTYGVSRGVDFQNVAAVINFDFPPSAENYTHRVGRTARGGKKGMSLSLIENDNPEELVLASQVEQSREKLGAKVQPFKFDLSQIEGFRYRAHDAMRSVTKTHVKEARLTELKEQILNSDKLQTHFEDRPQDLEFLRHDLPLLPKSVQGHLKHVPQYLLPKIQEVTSEGASLGKRHADDTSLGPIQFSTKHHKKYKQNKGKNKKLDPLKSFAKKMNNKRARK
jgi:ATP-dependent RNA helicase DDX56/DBP9